MNTEVGREINGLISHLVEQIIAEEDIETKISLTKALAQLISART